MAKRGSRESAIVRRLRTLELRKAGARYREIGAQLGVSHMTAFRNVKAARDQAGGRRADSTTGAGTTNPVRVK